MQKIQEIEGLDFFFWGVLVRAEYKLDKKWIDLMAFKKSKACHARVDKRMSWSGKGYGLESFCALIS